jgi:hypothetical protein
MAAAAASAASGAAAELARELNSAAAKARELAAQVARLAAAAFKAAAAQLKQAESWQARADAAWQQASADASRALSDENPLNIFNGGYHPIQGAELGAEALKETAVAGYDEIRAGIAFAAWAADEMGAFVLQFASDMASAAATVAAALARGAASASALAARVAAAAERNAQSMAAYAAEESAIASRDTADAEALSRAYAAQQARILAARLAALRAAAERALKRAAARIARAAKKAATIVKKAAVAVGKAAYKYSGAQSVVSCATHPNLSSCVQAAVAVAGAALTVATGGAGAAVDVGLDAAVEATADVAVDAGETAAETGAEDGAADAAEGGASMGEKLGTFAKNAFSAKQMAIGSGFGVVGNTANGYIAGERGWRLAETATVGAATGAFSNTTLGDGFVRAMGVGAVTGTVNGIGSQMVYNQSINPAKIGAAGWGGIVADGLLGAGESAAATGIGKGIGGEDPSVANAMGGFAGLNAGVLCGAIDSAYSKESDC